MSELLKFKIADHFGTCAYEKLLCAQAIEAYEAAKQSAQPDECVTKSSQLRFIAGVIESWVKWDSEHRRRENLVTDDDTHIMMLPVPVWPDHGMFKNWVSVCMGAAALLETPKRESVVLTGADIEKLHAAWVDSGELPNKVFIWEVANGNAPKG